ncbi:TIGR02221 family CRISPR-associated protein [Meiothermus sp.]|uniref:TIGR02221 family CRISPR-associated protein n=1 Tax=Meiothermus sp. TaxID=1955249 RepID=UPI0021DDFEC5|nr:TIGR02221 family CRISPR-associated protein [Meiothermus sp.]GIW24896.1 MAG: hypothetical protein KatS3mg069_1163 [Meiothermus sp.]
MKVVVSILGLGRWDKDERKYIYEETQYGWGDKNQVKTTLIQEAFAKWFPDAKFLLLATEKAQQERSDGIRNVLSGRDHQLVSIPDGKSADEFWEIYNALTNKLEAGSEVILDITHGFRSLGLLAFLAIVFLQASNRVKLLHVVYGAQEAKSADGITPIFDLTPFVTMLDWASATNRFLETGDASKFRRLVGGEKTPSELREGLEYLEELALAVSANRAFLSGDLACKASRIDQGLENWGVENEPLKLLVPKIKRGLYFLQLRPTPIKDFLVDLFRQILWYYHHGYYEKALGLAREWFITFVQYKCLEYGEIREDQIWPINDAIRNRWDKAIGRIGKNLLQNKNMLEQQVRPVFGKGFELSNEWKKLFEVWQILKDVRNDLLHFGFRSSPTEPDGVGKEVRNCLSELINAVNEMGLELPNLDSFLEDSDG